MSLDPKYICTSDLESVFLDKLTGLPLSAGYVEFYVDGTNTPKQVYTTTGSPPTGFIPLGTVSPGKITVTLDSIGQYSDGVNSKVLYYYPYASDNKTLELYECRVYNSGGQLQFTREAWPPLASNLAPSVDAVDGVRNYIPNGQFLIHNTNNHFVTDTTSEPGLTISEIAQGGWSFKHTTSGTGTYTISFNKETSFPPSLQDAPPYSVTINCTVFDPSDAVRDLVIQWPNVNTFSRTTTPNPFNFFFAAKLNSGTSGQFNVYLIRNYGSGGSTSDEDLLGSFTVSSSTAFSYFNIAVPMPNNTGKNLGDGNFVAIAIRTPSDTINVKFTDFALTLGSTQLTQFPIMTNDQQLSRGVAGWMPTPNPDGSDLYLPLVLTPEGMQFDHTVIGQVIGKLQLTADVGELLMDGSTYIKANYSSDGIPYARLGNYLIANSAAYSTGGGTPSTIDAANIPLFGTGANFVSIWKNFNNTKFDLSFNTSGANVASDGTSGFTHTSADPLYVYTVTAIPAAGTYFSFTPVASGLVYNVWFTVNGAGTAPSTPTGANIKVDLVTDDTIQTTIAKIQTAVNQYQFAVVNAKGFFWRGLGGVDPDASIRATEVTYNGSAIPAADIGSAQSAAFENHFHTPAAGFTQFVGLIGGGANAIGAGAGVGSFALTGEPNQGGGNETRPVNLALNWFIKY